MYLNEEMAFEAQFCVFENLNDTESFITWRKINASNTKPGVHNNTNS